MITLRRCWAFLLATLGAGPAALWILKHEQRILRRGRPLSRGESSFARRIGVERPESVRVLAEVAVPTPLGGWLEPLENRFGFSLRHAAGVTLDRGIYVAQQCESPELVAHELVHVRQYQDYRSPIVFIWHYFYQCIVHGYHDAPLEREAVELAGF